MTKKGNDVKNLAGKKRRARATKNSSNETTSKVFKNSNRKDRDVRKKRGKREKKELFLSCSKKTAEEKKNLQCNKYIIQINMIFINVS